MDNTLTFDRHLINTVAKANKVLGSLLRTSKDFHNDYTMVKLFNALVRPILEYGSIVWDPIYNYQINKLKSVQRKFINHIRFLNSRKNINMDRNQAHEYTSCTPLAIRREYLTFWFCCGASIVN